MPLDSEYSGSNYERNSSDLLEDYYHSPENDSLCLKKALITRNTREMFNILCNRTYVQINVIKSVFYQIFMENFIDIVDATMQTDPVKYIIRCLLYIDCECDSFILYNALHSKEIDMDIIIHIFCTRSSIDMANIKLQYSEMYKKELQIDVDSLVQGNIQFLLHFMCKESRVMSDMVSRESTRKIAEYIFSILYGPKIHLPISQTDISILQIFCKSSYAEIKAICESYMDLYQISLISSFEKKNGIYEFMLASICSFSLDNSMYNSQILRYYLAKMAIKPIIVLIITRIYGDLKDIIKKYFELYRTNLKDDIRRYFNSSYPDVAYALSLIIHRIDLNQNAGKLC